MRNGHHRYYDFDPSCKLYLPFDGLMQESPTIKVEDISDFKNHGTVTGAIPAWPGMTFDGVDDTINCGNDSSLTFEASGDYTWLGWIKTSRNNQHIIYKMDVFSGYSIEVRSSKLTFTNPHPISGASVSANTSIDDDLWHCFGMTYSNGAIKFYFDGDSDGNKTERGNNNSSDNFCISVDDKLQPVLGIIGEILIFNRVLLALDIKNYYERMRWEYGV